VASNPRDSKQQASPLRFEPDAQAIFYEWLGELEEKVRSHNMHPAMSAHLSKYRSLLPSLALLFHLVEWASTERLEPGPVNLSNTRRAAAYCEYLESHARRLYSCITTPQMRAARELAERIKRKDLWRKDTDTVSPMAEIRTFSAREVYLKGWSGLDGPDVVRMAAEVLVDAGWLRDLEGESGSTGGRPSRRYVVNPRVWERDHVA
jgi:putative DNA primase/helicase